MGGWRWGGWLVVAALCLGCDGELAPPPPASTGGTSGTGGAGGLQPTGGTGGGGAGGSGAAAGSGGSSGSGGAGGAAASGGTGGSGAIGGGGGASGAGGAGGAGGSGGGFDGDACLGDLDIIIIQAGPPNLRSRSAECGEGCGEVDPDFATCADECLEDDVPGLSAPCRSCYVDLAVCAGLACNVICAVPPNACELDCLGFTGDDCAGYDQCLSALNNCAGRDSLDCADDT
ncbi:MAG: hypothetical protein AAF436_04540 [Myxococcota bacterium]